MRMYLRAISDFYMLRMEIALPFHSFMRRYSSAATMKRSSSAIDWGSELAGMLVWPGWERKQLASSSHTWAPRSRTISSNFSQAIARNRTGALHNGIFCSRAWSIVWSIQLLHPPLLWTPDLVWMLHPLLRIGHGRFLRCIPRTDHKKSTSQCIRLPWYCQRWKPRALPSPAGQTPFRIPNIWSCHFSSFSLRSSRPRQTHYACAGWHPYSYC